MAELVGRRVVRATAWAEPLDLGTAFAAELHLCRIVMTTLRTPHDASPQKVENAQLRKRATVTSVGVRKTWKIL
jgi:hypothetical protein